MEGPKVVFSSAWWSVELPPGWRGHRDRECVTFQADLPIGALQISAARKENAPVTSDDLKDFAKERTRGKATLRPARIGEFDGFTSELEDDKASWREWWVRCKDIAIYATYNAPIGDAGTEIPLINMILASLRIAR